MGKINILKSLPMITAGFPSPADDFTDLSISLDKTLIQNPAATFMAYANGDSMIGIGIHHGDIIIIDKSLNAVEGDIIVAILNDEFLIKQLSYNNGNPILIPYNPAFKITYINKEMDFQVWGVVVHSIRSFR